MPLYVFMSFLIVSESRFDCIVIPSFTITSGEIVVIHLPSGPIFQTVVQGFQSWFTDFSQFWYVRRMPHRRLFFPMKVSAYIAKYGNPGHPIISSMYRFTDIGPDTTVSSLVCGDEKILALVTAISVNKNIVIDLLGVVAVKGPLVFNLLKENVAAGGAVVLLDTNLEFKEECTRFIEGIVVQSDINT